MDDIRAVAQAVLETERRYTLAKAALTTAMDEVRAAEAAVAAAKQTAMAAMPDDGVPTFVTFGDQIVKLTREEAVVIQAVAGATLKWTVETPASPDKTEAKRAAINRVLGGPATEPEPPNPAPPDIPEDAELPRTPRQPAKRPEMFVGDVGAYRIRKYR